MGDIELYINQTLKDWLINYLRKCYVLEYNAKQLAVKYNDQNNSLVLIKIASIYETRYKTIHKIAKCFTTENNTVFLKEEDCKWIISYLLYCCRYEHQKEKSYNRYNKINKEASRISNNSFWCYSIYNFIYTSTGILSPEMIPVELLVAAELNVNWY